VNPPGPLAPILRIFGEEQNIDWTLDEQFALLPNEPREIKKLVLEEEREGKRAGKGGGGNAPRGMKESKKQV
jgi:hypothetical protein